MATLQLLPVTTINGTTIATAQLILQQASPDRQKTILPKQEPFSPEVNTAESKTRKSNLSDLAKRRLHFSKKALTHPRPQSVTRRNARERNRVKQVNQGFITLANHVPAHLRSKKMSKVDTLKAAIDYIAELHDLLENVGPSEIQMPSSPASSCSTETSVSSPVTSQPSPIYHPESYNVSPVPHCQQAQQSYSASQQYAPPQYQQQYHHQSHQQQQINHQQYSSYDYQTYSSDTCPSPNSSDSGYDRHDAISPEVEAEILEFASWFQH